MPVISPALYGWLKTRATSKIMFFFIFIISAPICDITVTHGPAGKWPFLPGSTYVGHFFHFPHMACQGTSWQIIRPASQAILRAQTDFELDPGHNIFILYIKFIHNLNFVAHVVVWQKQCWIRPNNGFVPIGNMLFIYWLCFRQFKVPTQLISSAKSQSLSHSMMFCLTFEVTRCQ